MFEPSEFTIRVIHRRTVLARDTGEAEAKVAKEFPDADELEVVDEAPLCIERDERDER